MGLVAELLGWFNEQHIKNLEAHETDARTRLSNYLIFCQL